MKASWKEAMTMHLSIIARVFALVSIGMLVLGCAAAGDGDKRIVFARQFAPARFTLSRETTTDIAKKELVNGKEQTVHRTETGKLLAKVTIEVVDANGLPTRSTFAFDESCGEEARSDGGQPEVHPFAAGGAPL